MIRNDEELAAAVDMVNVKLKEIQRYLGDSDNDLGKIRFPRSYINTADHFRHRLSFINEGHLKDNLAYALIQTDVYRWLINRTDLYGVAKEMVIKSGIALMGSICETVAITVTKGVIGKNHGFCKRCDRMVSSGLISQELCDELQWLWTTRAGIHIYEIKNREYEKYSVRDYNRAIRAQSAFFKALTGGNDGCNAARA